MNTKETMYTETEVAEIISNLFGGDPPCNFSNIDEWLPFTCKECQLRCGDYSSVGCWKFYLRCKDGEKRYDFFEDS